jgi:hypothetical protein
LNSNLLSSKWSKNPTSLHVSLDALVVVVVPGYNRDSLPVYHVDINCAPPFFILKQELFSAFGHVQPLQMYIRDSGCRARCRLVWAIISINTVWPDSGLGPGQCCLEKGFAFNNDRVAVSAETSKRQALSVMLWPNRNVDSFSKWKCSKIFFSCSLNKLEEHQEEYPLLEGYPHVRLQTSWVRAS